MKRSLGTSKEITRRDLLKSAAFTAAALLVTPGETQLIPLASAKVTKQRLLTDWEYHQGQLGGPWDIWRTDNRETVLWQEVVMPHCFNSLDAVDPEIPYYQGHGWYRTKFKVANPYSQGRTLLYFEGAGQRSEVFVYLNRVGQHTGGYDEFTVDITEAVTSHPFLHGEVPIAVLCDNSRNLETIPSDLNDFPRYGGLHRYVNLIYVPEISWERIHIDAVVRSDDYAEISVKAKLYNPRLLAEDLKLHVRIFDAKGSSIDASQQRLRSWNGEREIAVFKLNDPKLWSPLNPSLYRCEVFLESVYGSTLLTEHFGCRYFEFIDHGPFKLNGERLLLKGTQREEDHSLIGAAMSEDLTSKELTLIKDMGANFIRLGHHQQSRTVLQLCDELGLLVWEEIPWSRGGLGGEEYKQEARNMLAAMIDQHYNHPSVIIWGLGNELDWPGDFLDFDAKTIRAFIQELNDAAHHLDPSRKTALRRCVFCSDVPDIYSPSIWAGWYRGPYTGYKSALETEEKKVKHLIHMEWGGESHAGRHTEEPDRLLLKALKGEFKDESERDYLLNCGQKDASEKGDWSETYICNLFDWNLKEQETMPLLAGSAQWIFKDFATPLRAHNPIPHVNEKGLVERDLTLKEGYFVFQSYWADKAMIHIYGHSWLVRWGEQQEEKLVRVYSNCERTELFHNGVSYGTKMRNSQDFPAAGLHWFVKFKSGENYLRAVGQKNGTTIMDEIKFQYQPQSWQHPARLELREVMRAGQIVTIEVRILDSSNVLCLDARNRVHFGLTGNGILLDNTGTTSGSRVVEVYNGRAEISLRTNSGQSVTSVSSEGLLAAFLPVT